MRLGLIDATSRAPRKFASSSSSDRSVSSNANDEKCHGDAFEAWTLHKRLTVDLYRRINVAKNTFPSLSCRLYVGEEEDMIAAKHDTF